MLNLSLSGSSINLSKSSLPSGRSSTKMSDKTLPRSSRSCREQPKVTRTVQNVHGSRSHMMSQNNSRPRLNLEDSEDECPVLHQQTGPAGDDKPSPLDKTRSKQNVADWLDTYIDQSPSAWEQIDLESIRSSVARSPVQEAATTRKPVDLELRVLLDSLDVSHESEEHAVKDANDDSLVTSIGDEFGPVEHPDEVDEPPPCHSRPISDSLITGRNQEGVQPEVTPYTDDHNLMERNNAARTIQLFWHRHKRRKLAARAALRRIMAEQKRRLDDRARTQGMPLRAVHERQKQLSEQRILKEHKNKVKALHEKRAQQTNAKCDDRILVPEKCQKSMKDKGNAERSIEIFQKPSSPMKTTPRYGRKSGDSNASVIPQRVRAEDGTSVASDDLTLTGEDTEHESDEVTAIRNDDATCRAHSTVDSIIQDLGRLSSLEINEDRKPSDSYNFVSKIGGPTSDDSPTRNERSKGWSEMLTEIHRVLSEPDEPEAFVYANDKLSYRKVPDQLVDSASLPSVGHRERPATVDSAVGSGLRANLLQPRLLTRKNLQEHSRRFNNLARRPRSSAQQELDYSVDCARSHLERLMLVTDNVNPSASTQIVPREMGSRKLSTITGALCDRVTSAPVARSMNLHNPTTSQQLLGQSFTAGLQSQLVPADQVYIHQLPTNTDLEVNALTIQLEEQSRAVQRLQRTVDQQRELSSRQLRDTQREAEQRLESVKADYEATINRNYKLIDELIEEKKALHAKCENLMTEMKTTAQKAEEKLKATEDRHKVDLRKAEAKFAAAEKLRREKWEIEKTKQMKEMTVRGMESELAQLIATHQAEVRQIRQSCAEQVQAADVRAYQAYTGQIEELRQTLTREKEEACAREREAANQRLEKTLHDERAALDQQRRRLVNEAAAERERLALTCAREREEIERNRQNLESRLEQLTAKYERELVQQREEIVKRHEREMNELQERDHTEREAWEEHTRSVLEAQYAARENTLRDQLKRDRDRQLEAAVQRLEAESNQAREEVEREADVKIRRIREKLGAEITELERSERQAMEKYCEMKTKLLDKEQETDRLRMQLQQKEQEMQEIRSLYEKLNKERQNLSDVVRQEFADRLVGLEEENRTVKRELAESKARLSREQERHEADLQAVKKANAAELEEVHLKIKEAIKRKEDKTNAMRKTYEEALAKQASDVAEANRRADHLEELLDQQRQQFLKATTR